MGWPSTVNFSKDRRVAALPRPAGVWAISNGTIASPATTALIIMNRFIPVSCSIIASHNASVNHFASARPNRVF